MRPRWHSSGLSKFGVAVALLALTGCEQKTAEAPPAKTAPASEKTAQKAPEPPAPVIPTTQRSRHLMGTGFAVQIAGVNDAAAARAADAALAECARLEDILSEWRPHTPISKLNQKAGQGPQKMPPELMEVLLAAQRLSRRSEGAFDVTWAALRGIWKFDAERKIPGDEALAGPLKKVGYDKVLLDEAASTAELKEAGMALGLGAIGKGYAVEKMAQMLRAAGYSDFMIFAGGQVYGGGQKGGRPWRVGILDPRRKDRYFAKIELIDEGMATSGDYERYFIKEGKRYHHILDLKTGRPARSGLISVTIVSKDATVSDGLSTAVFVLGREKGLKLLEDTPGAEGVLVDSEGKVHMTSGVKGRVTITEQPGSGP